MGTMTFHLPPGLPDDARTALERASVAGGQVYYASFPDGKTKRLTNDLSQYALPVLSVTPDASARKNLPRFQSTSRPAGMPPTAVA